MDRHIGYTCYNCFKKDFKGLRFKCLLCDNFNLCNDCYDQKVSTEHHAPGHPLQCVVTKSESELYEGGELMSSDHLPKSLTCPFCSEMGFTDILLNTHIINVHNKDTRLVFCPLCVIDPPRNANVRYHNLSRHFIQDHGVEDLQPVVSDLDDDDEAFAYDVSCTSRSVRPGTPISLEAAIEAVVRTLSTSDSEPTLHSSNSYRIDDTNITGWAALKKRAELVAARYQTESTSKSSFFNQSSFTDTTSSGTPPSQPIRNFPVPELSPKEQRRAALEIVRSQTGATVENLPIVYTSSDVPSSTNISSIDYTPESEYRSLEPEVLDAEESSSPSSEELRSSKVV